jgi:Sec-independent protein translocase protein TatA
MSFLGVGPLELLFIVIIAIIIVGPRDITKTARTLGRTINRIYRSELWRTLTETGHAIRDLPNRLAKEARLEDLDAIGDPFKNTREEISREMSRIEDGLKAWTSPPGMFPLEPKDEDDASAGEHPGSDGE